MSSERTVPPLLPFVATHQLTDHHCHGVLRSGGVLDELLNEADGAAARDGLAFDTLAGLAFRRWCPPLLGLPAHSSVSDYRAQREALDTAELNRRFLQASGLAALFVDTGYTSRALLSPAETAAFAGAAAFEVVRLEQVAEALGADGVAPAEFPDAYRAALAERVTSPGSGVPVAGVKSIAAYRVGLALDARRPRDAEVATGTSTCIGVTRCCSRSCCGRWSRPGRRSCYCTTTRTTGRPATWPRSSRTCSRTSDWLPTTSAPGRPKCSPRRSNSCRCASSCSLPTPLACRSFTT